MQIVGLDVDVPVGTNVGDPDVGWSVGNFVGVKEGLVDGFFVGANVGDLDVGWSVGTFVGVTEVDGTNKDSI